MKEDLKKEFTNFNAQTISQIKKVILRFQKKYRTLKEGSILIKKKTIGKLIKSLNIQLKKANYRLNISKLNLKILEIDGSTIIENYIHNKTRKVRKVAKKVKRGIKDINKEILKKLEVKFGDLNIKLKFEVYKTKQNLFEKVKIPLQKINAKIRLIKRIRNRLRDKALTPIKNKIVEIQEILNSVGVQLQFINYKYQEFMKVKIEGISRPISSKSRKIIRIKNKILVKLKTQIIRRINTIKTTASKWEVFYKFKKYEIKEIIEALTSQQLRTLNIYLLKLKRLIRKSKELTLDKIKKLVNQINNFIPFELYIKNVMIKGKRAEFRFGEIKLKKKIREIAEVKELKEKAKRRIKKKKINERKTRIKLKKKIKRKTKPELRREARIRRNKLRIRLLKRRIATRKSRRITRSRSRTSRSRLRTRVARARSRLRKVRTRTRVRSSRTRTRSRPVRTRIRSRPTRVRNRSRPARTRIRPRVRPIRSKVKPKIKPPIEKDDNYDKKRGGYFVYIKLQGMKSRYQKVGKFSLVRPQAVAFGRFVTDNLPFASYKILRSGKVASQKTKIKLTTAKKFRKKLITSRLGPGIEEVEKNKYRIDKPGEKKGITVKGIAKAKSVMALLKRIKKKKNLKRRKIKKRKR